MAKKRTPKPAGATGLTDRQRRFVGEYLVDLNATQAAIRAGYEARTANQQGPRLLVNVGVRAAIDAALAARSGRTQVTADWVVGKLKLNVERAMQEVPVTDREGAPTGEYTYEGAVANGALKLLGQHLGLFRELKEVRGELRVYHEFERLRSLSADELVKLHRAALALPLEDQDGAPGGP